MKLHYGIISCASICDRFIHAVNAYGDLVEAIASRSYTKALHKAKEHHIPKAYGSYEELYQDPTIDIVYIATNNATHGTQIRKALSYGKHVLCEKPLALSQQEAQELFSYANECGCFLMEAQKSVFLPVTNDIQHMIHTQALGKLHQVEMSSSFPNPTASWMHDATQGGVVYGSASYTLEYLDMLLQPKRTRIQAIGFLEPKGACERVSMNLCMDNVLINSRISMNGTTRHHALFYFEKGYIEVPNYWKARSYTLYQDQEQQTITHPIDYEMVYEVEHVHTCLEQGRLLSPIMDDQRTIRCCGFVDEIQKQLNKEID